MENNTYKPDKLTIKSAETQTLALSAVTLQNLLTAIERGESDGICVGELVGARVSKKVFAAAFALLGTMFGIDYFEYKEGPDGSEVPATPDTVKARFLYEELQRMGWTDKEFTDAFNRFIMRVKYTQWTYAEFFGEGQRVKLHPYSWVLKEREKDPSAMRRMIAYNVPGCGIMWRYADGEQVPFPVHEFAGYSPEELQPEPRQRVTDQAKENARLIYKNALLENRVQRLEEERAAQQAVITQLTEQIESQKQTILELLNEENIHGSVEANNGKTDAVYFDNRRNEDQADHLERA